jgi:hypothetical protein
MQPYAKERKVRRFVCRVGRLRVTDRKTFIRWQMPCGTYHCADGREVLYDRDYAPICERSPGVPPRRSDPSEWIKGVVRQEWLYVDDAKTPYAQKLRIAEAKLAEWGMLPSVTAEIEEAVRNSEYFSWRHGEWRHSRKKAA